MTRALGPHHPPKRCPRRARGSSGALAGSALARNRLIRNQAPKSAGVLRDQQTLGETTGTHGHLLLFGLAPAGDAFGDLGPQAGSATSLLAERCKCSQEKSAPVGAPVLMDPSIRGRCPGAEPLQGRRSFRAAGQPVPSRHADLHSEECSSCRRFQIRGPQRRGSPATRSRRRAG